MFNYDKYDTWIKIILDKNNKTDFFVFLKVRFQTGDMYFLYLF